MSYEDHKKAAEEEKEKREEPVHQDYPLVEMPRIRECNHPSPVEVEKDTFQCPLCGHGWWKPSTINS